MIKKAYDDYAAKYDQLVVETKYAVPAWLDREFPASLKGREVSCLDLACGSGVIGLQVQKINPRAVLFGLDLSPKMIAQAAEKKIYRELFVHNIDEGLSDLGVPPVELITAFGFLEFVRDLNFTLREIARCLAPGGILLASFQVYDPEGGSKSRTYQNKMGFNHTTYTPSEVENMLQEWFTVEKLEPVVGYVSPSSGDQCKYLLVRAVKLS